MATEPKWPKRGEKWLGFDGRLFLSYDEWMAYRRRPPVRYASASRPIVADDKCEVCREASSQSNVLQIAHRIPFIEGVLSLAICPDFLDSRENLAVGHRRMCNKKLELDLNRSLKLLQELGLTELPYFLDLTILKAWSSILHPRGKPLLP